MNFFTKNLIFHPRIDLECSMLGTTITMAVMGVSLSAAIIPSCAEMVEIARREGCAEQASSFIAGLMNSLVFFGEFVGPATGGLFIEMSGGSFPIGASYFALCAIGVVLCCK